MARIYTLSENKDKEIIKEFVGIGLFISKNGDIVAQKQDFVTEKDTVKKDYYISFNEKEIKVILNNNLIENNFVFLKTEELKEKIVYNSIEIENSNNLQLGQSVIVLGGETSDMLLTGIISNLTRDKIIITEATADKKAEEKIIVTRIETNLTPEKSMTALINLSGKVIGIKSDNGFFTPINAVQEAFISNNLTETAKE